MPKEKKNRDEYPKINADDKRWKEQEEFDSAGAQRELEDKEKNSSISERDNHENEEKGAGY